MKIGLIGVGTVGGTLKKYFQEKTNHELACYDPGKGLADNFEGVEACFISVPVPANATGQDITALKLAVENAKMWTPLVFVRSTVLPGTNDKLGTIACHEFLTERRAFEDMCKLPILVGQGHKENRISEIFPDKDIIPVSNIEAELAKFTHNCFGAMKVTYFNIISELCRSMKADYENVRMASNLTGFIGREHTQVPGPDGLTGYGGKCFPENIKAMRGFLMDSHDTFAAFFDVIDCLNEDFRFDYGKNNYKTHEQSVDA